MSDEGIRSILYDARTVRPGMSGVGRYTLNLLAALAALPEAPPMRALFLKESAEIARRDPALRNVEVIEAPFSHESHPAGDAWLHWGVRRLARQGEVYHGPAFIIPGGAQPIARVATVHDLFVFTHPRFYGFKFRLWLRWATARACRFAGRIIVPTQTVKDGIVARNMAPAERVDVIAEAPDSSGELWDAPALGRINDVRRLLDTGPARPKIVSVGTLDPRKDPRTARAALVRLHGMLDEGVDWLWIGGAGSVADDTPEDLKEEAAALGFHTLGHAPGAAIRPALRESTAYVSCSRTEGFGIPLVEAMAAGCPVVASDIAVHREVAGDAALYFPEGDGEALADRLCRLVRDAALREALRVRGLERAERFTWTRAAHLTLDAYGAAHGAFGKRSGHERSDAALYKQG